MSNSCIIAANDDVSGIGIRINLYTTVLLMAVIPDIPGLTTPLVNVLAENAGISGFALLITALSETHRGRLSLYHAIFIIHILYFTGIMVAPTGHYKHDTIKRRAIVSGLVTYGGYLVFTGYALYVWGNAQKLSSGNSFKCKDSNTKPSNEEIENFNRNVEYILFFRPFLVSATWLRVVWMVGLGISLALLVFFPVFGCICVFKRGVIAQGQPSHPINPLFFWVVRIGKILTAVYGVATLEIYESTNWRNGVLAEPENNWSFGQVFALVQLITTLNEAFHCLISALGTYSESSHSADDSDDDDQRSITSTHERNSTASSRITNMVRFGFGLRTGENGSQEPAPDEDEADNLDTKRPEPIHQPVYRGQTQGAMMLV